MAAPTPSEWLSARFSLVGKTAMVTGPTRGIGRSLAMALAAAGAHIILLQRDASQLGVQEEIQRLDGKATIFPCDLSDKSQVRGIVQKVVDAGFLPDILVNSGGINRRHPAEKFPDNDLEDVSSVAETLHVV